MWGEKFRSYFTDWCLPTLLSPGNIPSLPRGPAHKFLIATTREDWDALQQTAIFQQLTRYLEPVLVEIDPAPPGVSGCEHMGIGHKLCTAIAFRERAYGFLLTPDFMLTEGAVAALVRHAAAGCQVVMTVALRFAEEPLFAALRHRGLFPEGSSSGLPVALPPRQAAAVSLDSFHSETICYEFDAPFFADFPVAAIWWVPGKDAAVIHSFSWAPLLLDYGAISQHDDSTLDEWTIDGDYVHKNFADAKAIHIVEDSDEMMILSWAPLDDRPRDLRPQMLKGQGLFGRWYRGQLLYGAFHSPLYDPFKRNIFSRAVLWHGGDPCPAIETMTRHAKAEIDRTLASSTASHIAFRLLNSGMRGAKIAWYVVRRSAGLLFGAITGDPSARQRLRRRMRLIMAGRPLSP
jgi:hypothetical protein